MRSKLLFMLFLAATLACSSNLVHARLSFSIKVPEDLINQICESTINPSFCLNFLNSDPHSATASLQGLAQTTIDKAESNAKSTSNSIGGLLKSAQDPTLKEKYKSCLENFEDAISNLDQARTALAAPGPGSGDLNNFASSALTDVDTCGEDFAAAPPQLKEATQKLGSIIGVLLAISNSL